MNIYLDAFGPGSGAFRESSRGVGADSGGGARRDDGVREATQSGVVRPAGPAHLAMGPIREGRTANRPGFTSKQVVSSSPCTERRSQRRGRGDFARVFASQHAHEAADAVKRPAFRAPSDFRREECEASDGVPTPLTTGAITHVWRGAGLFLCANGVNPARGLSARTGQARRAVCLREGAKRHVWR